MEYTHKVQTQFVRLHKQISTLFGDFHKSRPLSAKQTSNTGFRLLQNRSSHITLLKTLFENDLWVRTFSFFICLPKQENCIKLLFSLKYWKTEKDKTRTVCLYAHIFIAIICHQQLWIYHSETINVSLPVFWGRTKATCTLFSLLKDLFLRPLLIYSTQRLLRRMENICIQTVCYLFCTVLQLLRLRLHVCTAIKN